MPSGINRGQPKKPWKSSRAAIHHLSGYSAHTGQQTLCDWVNSMPEPPGEIRLVHGEPQAQKALRAELNASYKK